MSDESHKIPYREGEPAPGPEYILADVVDAQDNKQGLYWLLPKDLKRAPPQHDEVNVLLPMLRWVWRHLSQHIAWCRSFEDWELGFMRDGHPETETAVWLQTCYAYLEFLHQHPGVNEKAVFAALVAMMTGREDKVKPPSVLEALKALSANPPTILLDSDNFTADGYLKTGEEHLR
jgi:hypothetical protein